MKLILLFLCFFLSSFGQTTVTKYYNFHWLIAKQAVTINPFIDPDLKYLGIYEWLTGAIESRAFLGEAYFLPPILWDDIEPHIYEISYQSFSPWVGYDNGLILQKTGYGSNGLIFFQINLTNTPPVAPNIYKQVEATTPLAISYVGIAYDPDNDPISFFSITQPSSGSTYWDGSSIIFLSNVVGISSFQYKITDLPDYGTGTITVTVLPYTCYGFARDSQNVCSSNGVCSSSNNCTCYSGFSGLTCSIPSCYGVNQTDPNVCSGKGSCPSLNNCTCVIGYSGLTCSVSSCFGINGTDTNVCSGKGVCSSLDNCTCNSGYTGTICNLISCFGVNATENNVCSGNGACIGPNKCQCNDGYTGQNCQFPVCFGLNSTDPSTCSGMGNCTSPNVCKCNNGWNGMNCAYYTCNGVNSTYPNVCSTNGNCTNVDTCKCKGQWSGNNCQFAQCFGINATQPNVCSGNGNCSNIDQCVCNSGWVDQNCSTFTCFGVNFTDPLVCNGKGTCIGVNNCHCNPFWSGNNCQFPYCYGYSASDGNVCNGKGTCVDVDQCNCTTGWKGANCYYTECFGLNSTDTSTCNGNGNCTDFNTCKCKEFTTGTQCQYCQGSNCELYWKGLTGDWNDPKNWWMNFQGKMLDIENVPTEGNFFIVEPGSYSINFNSITSNFNSLIVGGQDSNIILNIFNSNFNVQEFIIQKMASVNIIDSNINIGSEMISNGEILILDSNLSSINQGLLSNCMIINNGSLSIQTRYINMSISIPIENYSQFQVSGNQTLYLLSYIPFDFSTFILSGSSITLSSILTINHGNAQLGGVIRTPYFYFSSTNGNIEIISPLKIFGNATFNQSYINIPINGSNINWIEIDGKLTVNSLIIASLTQTYSKNIKLGDSISLFGFKSFDSQKMNVILVGDDTKDVTVSQGHNQLNLDVITSLGNDNLVSKCHYLGNRKNLNMKLLPDQMIVLSLSIPPYKSDYVGFGFDLNGNITNSIIIIGNISSLNQISLDSSKPYLPIFSSQMNQISGLFGNQFPSNLYTISMLIPSNYLLNQTKIYYIEKNINSTSLYLETYSYKILIDMQLNPNNIDCTNFLQPTRVEIYQIGITITILLFYILLFIICIILYRFHPLNSRGLSPLLTLLFLFIQLCIEFRNYYLPPAYQSSLCVAFSYGIYPLQQICFIMILFYFWRYFSIINLNESKKTLSKFASEEHLNTYYLWRTRILKLVSLSNFPVILMIISYIGSLFIHTIIMGSTNFICKFQTLLSLKVYHSIVFILIFIFMFITFISDLYANYHLFKKCKYIKSDLYYFRTQILLFLPFMLFIFISQIVLLNYSNSYESILRSYISNIIINTFTFSILLLIEVIYPILITIYILIKKKKLQNNQSNEILKLMDHSKLKEIFIDFCKQEFCLEYFSFYEDIQKFKEDQQSTYNIYTKYLKGFLSPLQLKLPSEVLNKVIQRMKQNETEKDLFDECEIECLKVLADVFDRFQDCEEFKEYLNQNQNEMEDKEENLIKELISEYNQNKDK